MGKLLHVPRRQCTDVTDWQPRRCKQQAAFYHLLFDRWICGMHVRMHHHERWVEEIPVNYYANRVQSAYVERKRARIVA